MSEIRNQAAEITNDARNKKAWLFVPPESPKSTSCGCDCEKYDAPPLVIAVAAVAMGTGAGAGAGAAIALNGGRCGTAENDEAATVAMPVAFILPVAVVPEAAVPVAVTAAGNGALIRGRTRPGMARSGAGCVCVKDKGCGGCD